VLLLFLLAHQHTIYSSRTRCHRCRCFLLDFPTWITSLCNRSHCC
jgi:hypothetical protein